MELRQIRYFTVVAVELSFTAPHKSCMCRSHH